MVKMLKTVLNTDKTALAKKFKFSEFCRNYKIVTNIFGYFDEEFNLFLLLFRPSTEFIIRQFTFSLKIKGRFIDK